MLSQEAAQAHESDLRHSTDVLTSPAWTHNVHIRAALRVRRETQERTPSLGLALIVLSFNARTVAKRIREGTRFDQPFVDFLKARKVNTVDLMEAHLADYAQHKMDVKDYLNKYYIGHYNPLGNFFCAFAMKNALVRMLDPKPSSYLPP